MLQYEAITVGALGTVVRGSCIFRVGPPLPALFFENSDNFLNIGDGRLMLTGLLQDGGQADVDIQLRPRHPEVQRVRAAP
jgi:hypothetical protein